nr:sigma-70 family RNA polymerase sigma factor [uncultured Butyricicoccus sp.]
MNWKSPEEASRFVTRYADTILRLCMTYSLSRADAQDICQTVFCRLLRADMTFDTPEVERAYVIRCTINACKDLLKSAWWRRHATLHEASHLAAPIVPEPDDTLYNAVQALPLRYREPVYLFYYEGYDTNEIAQLLHISPATVRKRLCRAREKLKQELEGYCHETLY